MPLRRINRAMNDEMEGGAILRGNIVLLSGATGGFGKVLSRRFVKTGADLLLLGRNIGLLEKLAAELFNGGSGRVQVVAVDLKSPESIAESVSSILETRGAPDILINNAGIQGPIGPAWENDWRLWEETVKINLLAPVMLCRSFIPEMIKKGRGRIINISGGGAADPRPYFSAYAASKAAIVRYSETLALELAGKGITVNCIAPGALKSKMTQDVINAGADRAGQKEYRQAIRLSEEFDERSVIRAADLAVFLASDRSVGISGKLISAVWDPWTDFEKHKDELRKSDIYTLRRIMPDDRGKQWDEK